MLFSKSEDGIFQWLLKKLSFLSSTFPSKSQLRQLFKKETVNAFPILDLYIGPLLVSLIYYLGCQLKKTLALLLACQLGHTCLADLFQKHCRIVQSQWPWALRSQPSNHAVEYEYNCFPLPQPPALTTTVLLSGSMSLTFLYSSYFYILDTDWDSTTEEWGAASPPKLCPQSWEPVQITLGSRQNAP